nr:MAG TPA: hypothetical protein [Caudoviricetes sp.]
MNRRYTLHCGYRSRLTTFHGFSVMHYVGSGYSTPNRGCAYHLSSYAVELLMFTQFFDVW